MAVIGWTQFILFCAIVAAIAPLFGGYITRVFNGERTFLTPVLRLAERVLCRVAAIDEAREQHWLTYTVVMLLFHAAGFLVLYGLMRRKHAVRTAAR